MTKLFSLAFVLGLAVPAWIAAGFAGSSWLGVLMTATIAAAFLWGALELRQFRGATATLRGALAGAAQPPESLAHWLQQLPAGLREPVRLRVQDGRGGLPGPSLAPYLVGLLVMLGMLGTFLGMVVTFRGTVFALEGSADLQAMRLALAQPIRGLGLSFGTSVAGVAASAMLGLMLAIARRERVEVARQLDEAIVGALQPFSLAHQRQEGWRALQAQAGALPQVVEQLAALVQRIDQRGMQLDTQLQERQAALQRELVQAHGELARRSSEALEAQAAATARAAGEAIAPVLESAVARIEAHSAGLQERLAAAFEERSLALSERLEQRSAALLTGLEQRSVAWADDMAQRSGAITGTLEQRSQALTESIEERNLTLAQTLEQRSAALVDALEARSLALVQALEQRGSGWAADLQQRTTAWTEAIEQRTHALVEGLAQRSSELTGSLEQRSAALFDALQARSTALVQDVEQRSQALVGALEQRSTVLADDLEQRSTALTDTLEQRSAAWLSALSEHATQAQAQQAAEQGARLQAWNASLQAMARELQAGWQRVGEASTQLLQQSQDLVRQRAEDEARWTTAQGERMEQLAGLWRDGLADLRAAESERGAAAVARLGALEAAVARHLASLGTALEAPLTRLLQTASEVPQAAAGVITQLREEMGRLAARDQLALEERTELLAQMRQLLQSVGQASDEQRAATEALVASASSVLQDAGAQFTQALQQQAAEAGGLTTQLATGAVELASVAEAFGQGVQLFQAGNDKLVESLERMEASLRRATARSDEQLAYYVAQAREVIDLSIASQQGVVDSLRQLHGVAPQPVAQGAAG